MDAPIITSAQETKDLVDQVDVTPEYFVREDGTRMAVINADFLDRIMAVYADATVETLEASPGIYDMKLNGE